MKKPNKLSPYLIDIIDTVNEDNIIQHIIDQTMTITQHGAD